MKDIEPDDMPVCPLCDNAMLDWDELVVFSAHGVSALAHKSCLEESVA